MRIEGQSENINGLAQWDGSSWKAVGSGIQGGTNPIILNSKIDKNGNNLYICGGFRTAGKKVTPFLAKYRLNNKTKKSQSISFSLNGNEEKTYGDSPLSLKATATSGLVVDLQSSNPTVASISNATLTIHTSGYTTISAYQEGDMAYNAAPVISHSLLVRNKKLSLKTMTNAQNKVYDGSTKANLSKVELNGVISGDEVKLIQGIGYFSEKSVSKGKTVNVIGFILDGKDSKNYSVEPIPTLKADISPAPLKIKADKKIKLVNTMDPPLTVSYDHFVGGEDESIISNLKIKRELGESLGIYSIIPSGAIAPNYTVTYINGKLTITDEVAIKTSFKNNKNDNSILYVKNPVSQHGNTIFYLKTKNAKYFTMSIYDPLGNIIFQHREQTINRGQVNQIIWNGKNQYGKTVAPSTYSAVVELFDTIKKKSGFIKTSFVVSK